MKRVILSLILVLLSGPAAYPAIQYMTPGGYVNERGVGQEYITGNGQIMNEQPGFPVGWAGYVTHSVTTEPGSDLTDFTYLVSLDQFPSDFWTNIQTDGDDIRASKDTAGTTELAVDIIEFTDNGTTGTGLIAVKFSGTKDNATDEPIYIWAGNANAIRPTAADTFGQYAAYPSHIRSFYPSGGGNGRTSFQNNLTMTGSPTVGGVAGPINGSKATDYNGSSQYGTSTTSVPTAVPLAMLAHGNSDSDTVTQNAVGISDTAGTGNYFRMAWAGSVAGDPIRATTAATTASNADSIAGYTASAWALGSAHFFAANDRRARINGANGGTETTSKTPAGVDTICVGALTRSDVINHFDGDLSFVLISTDASILFGDWTSYWKEMLDDTDQVDFYGTWTWTAVGASNAVAIASPGAGQGYQRDGSDQADITIDGTCTDGEPVEARFNGGSWATIDSSTTGGTYTGTLDNQTIGQGLLEVRLVDDPATIDSIDDVTIGDVFAVAGQSNAVGHADNLQTHTGTFTLVVYRQDGIWRVDNSDPTDMDSNIGSPWPLFSTLVEAAESVPVILITTATGNTGLVDPGDWDQEGTPSTDYANAAQQVIDSGVNAVKAVLWHQGETDINNSVSRATYNAELDDLIADLRAEGGALANTVLVCAQVGHKTTGSPTDAMLNAVRLAQSDAWDDNANIHAGPTLYEVNLSDSGGDGVHFENDSEVAVLARRWWAAVDDALYGGSTGRGPKVVSVALSGPTQITVVFNQVLRTGLTFTANAWKVGGDGTPPTVSSVAYHGSNTSAVVLTLSGALTTNPTLSLGNGNDAAGDIVPQSLTVALPIGGNIHLPPEIFVDRTVSVNKLPIFNNYQSQKRWLQPFYVVSP